MRRPLLSVFLALFPLLASAEPAAPIPKSLNDGSRGAELYGETCALCHLSDGRGIPNVEPSLISDPLIAAPSPATLIQVILRGPAAVLPPSRTKYPIVMPPLSGWSDRDIADVVSYLRQVFGPYLGAVTPADVAAARLR